MEGRLIEKVQKADRANLANGTSPDIEHFLPESDQSDMEFFLAQIEVVLPVVGVDILRERPKPVVSSDRPKKYEEEAQSVSVLELVLELPRHNYRSEAVEKDGEFVVLKGSTAYANPPHATNSYSNLREQLIEQGVLVHSSKQSDLLEFTQDVVFNSPSAAASVINGRNSNGRTNWKLKKSGQTLKDWQLSQLDTSPNEDE